MQSHQACRFSNVYTGSAGALHLLVHRTGYVYGPCSGAPITHEHELGLFKIAITQAGLQAELEQTLPC